MRITAAGFFSSGVKASCFITKVSFFAFFASFLVFLLVNMLVNYCIISELETFNRTFNYV